MSEEKPADPAAEGAPAEGEEAQVDGYGGGAGSRIESSHLRGGRGTRLWTWRSRRHRICSM